MIAVKRWHRMPFGAELSEDDKVRFRLWAPAAREVALLLEEGEAAIAMDALAEGWFQVETAQARPGTRYRYLINRDLRVPDPASRYNPDDVHGASEVIDPRAFSWSDARWRGRPWHEAVIYELHIGAFTASGTFAAVKDRFDHLAALGVTVLEIMPVADFPGRWNWGYDGVLLFAPEGTYGRPEDLKDLVQSAHAKGLMVLLDVVYNHFGPEGNYLHAYAPQFFTHRHRTPWGQAIDFGGPRVVRDFFIHNALYWLEEFHLDGLRLDAVHAICDDSEPHILRELAAAVRAGPAKERHIHLVLENDRNEARYLERGADGSSRCYDAQWNDDTHHALHVLLTGETDGYYGDYREQPIDHLGRCLSEGFAYQGEASPYRDSRRRGEPSRELPPTAFVSFLQNHDQIGNRAFGERLASLAAPYQLKSLVAILLLAPSPPLLFMGEEWGSEQPFLFFCDFEPELAGAVTEGRRAEFARFDRFRSPENRASIPDPSAASSFHASRLDWSLCSTQWLAFYRKLLRLRAREIIPRLSGMGGGGAGFEALGTHALRVRWTLGDGATLTLLANLGPEAVCLDEPAEGRLLYADGDARSRRMLPGWSTLWYLLTGRGQR